MVFRVRFLPRGAIGAAGLLLLAACGCAGSSLERRQREVESRLAQARTELQQLGPQAAQAFQEASQAEARAGLAGEACAAVTPASGGVTPLPRSRVRHALLRLDGVPPSSLMPTWAKAKQVQGRSVSAGRCEVVRR